MWRHLLEISFVFFSISILNSFFRLGRRRTPVSQVIEKPADNVVYLNTSQRQKVMAR